MKKINWSNFSKSLNLEFNLEKENTAKFLKIQELTKERFKMLYSNFEITSKPSATKITFEKIKKEELFEDDFLIHFTQNEIRIEASKVETLWGAFLFLLKNWEEDFLLLQMTYQHKIKIKERGVHLDAGRKYFSKKFFENLLVEMNLNNLNSLQWHFSENEGFRLESKEHPEILSKNFISQKEANEIIILAHQLGIQIVPSLDMPGHLEQVLKAYPNYKLHDEKMQPIRGAFDLSNEEAGAFLKDLLKEFLEFFKDSKYFTIGGDEFVDFREFNKFKKMTLYAQEKLGISQGTSSDTYALFLNQAASLVEEYQKIPRFWNDGLYRLDYPNKIEINSKAQICYWTRWDRKMAHIDAFLKRGYKMLNFDGEFLYYVLREKQETYPLPSVKRLREEFNPLQFSGDFVKVDPSQVQGSYFSIWCDYPDAKTEATVEKEIRPFINAFGLKLF